MTVSNAFLTLVLRQRTTFLAIAGALAMSGCTSNDLTLGERLTGDARVATANARAATQAERDIERGEALIERGRGRVSRGESEVSEGRDLVERGEATLRRIRRDVEAGS